MALVCNCDGVSCRNVQSAHCRNGAKADDQDRQTPRHQKPSCRGGRRPRFVWSLWGLHRQRIRFIEQSEHLVQKSGQPARLPANVLNHLPALAVVQPIVEAIQVAANQGQDRQRRPEFVGEIDLEIAVRAAWQRTLTVAQPTVGASILPHFPLQVVVHAPILVSNCAPSPRSCTSEKKGPGPFASDRPIVPDPPGKIYGRFVQIVIGFRARLRSFGQGQRYESSGVTKR